MNAIWAKQPKNKREQPLYWARLVDQTREHYIQLVSAHDEKKQEQYRSRAQFVQRQAKRAIARLCTHYPELPPPPARQDHRMLPTALTDQQTWFITADRLLNPGGRHVSASVAHRTDAVTIGFDGSGRSSESPDPEAVLPHLSSCYVRAYRSYTSAIRQNPDLAGAKDKQIHDWLSLNGSEEYEDRPIPNAETWARYLRAVRIACGTQRNTSRKGRTGRSIISSNQV